MIPTDFIQTLLSRVDIVDVVERYVSLKKSGANFAACCPFHNEKSPSFTVSPTKQFYHCFGCGAHGTAIGFLMEHAGMSFPEAVEHLAQQVGIPVPRTSSAPEQTGQRKDELAQLSDLMEAAAVYYKNQLRGSPRAINYLKQRGLTGEIAARFRLGFAPDNWQNLEAAVPDYSDQSLETAGLVVVGDGGKRYDRFRDRIMFPITDMQGRVIGFGGRVLDKGEPKYLNSPETPLFVKGRELYGLHQARTAIRDAGRVIVVEGYMDTVALAQQGIEYVVAALGTATTADHVKKLFRQADRIVFSFDGDAAGQRAAWRALENALPVLADGKEVAFLFLPEEHDPDTFVREFGRKAFEAKLEQATPLSDYFIGELERRHPTATAEGRAALVAEAKPYFEALSAPVLRLMLQKRLAEKVGFSENELASLLPAARPAPPLAATPAASSRNSPRMRSAAPEAPVQNSAGPYLAIIRYLLQRPSLVASFTESLPRFPSREAQALGVLLSHLREHGDPALTTGPLVEALQNTDFAAIYRKTSRLIADMGDTGEDEAAFGDALTQYRVFEQKFAQRQELSERSDDQD
ncbi:MAG: DNA primase [Casimicrobiaceae bacterium]